MAFQPMPHERDAMQPTHFLIAISLLTLSTPLAARTFECTELDKAHWITAEGMRERLAAQGYEVISLSVSDSCYKATLKTENGQKIEGIYHPIGGHPLRRQTM